MSPETYKVGEKTKEGLYDPSEEQLENHRIDKKQVDRDLRYRAQFEAPWKHGAEKWNQVAPQGLEGTPNYVVPISRMATHTGVVSMRQSLPEIRPVPEGPEEKKLGYIIGEASAHIHRMCNMEGVMDQGLVDYAVIGNMVLESFVNIPYKCQRTPILDKKGKPTGKFENVYKRDWSKPKIGTRSRSPWECAFDAGARTPAEIRCCWFQERLTEEQFDEVYRNRPDNEYINLDCVRAGVVYSIADTGDLERTEVKHKQIIVDNVQNELTDSWRKYANGVLIWDVPLSSVHCHGKITLSLIPNHHKYDANLKTHALYGTGDPELLSDLDDLINAMTNMFILNYRQKNTYVVGIEGAADIDEIDFSTGSPIKGKVSVQSLGAADLPEWQNFKNEAEEWAIQLVKKNYRRLEGEVAKTAYEAAQKKSDENKGMQYQTKRMEAGGLLEYAKKHMSDIMEHLTVEEWEDVLDEDRETVKELLKSGEIGQKDVVRRKIKGKLVPVRVRYVEKIRTRGKVYEENYKKGERSLDDLREIKSMRGQDGWLAASKEYLTTKNWRLFKKIPDIYLVGKTILGQDDLMELGKLEQYLGFLERVANLQSLEKAGQINLGIDYDKLSAKGAEAIDIRKEELTKTEGDERISRTQESIKKAKEMKNQLLNPRLYAKAQAAQAALQSPVQGGTPVPGGRPAPQAAQGSPALPV